MNKESDQQSCNRSHVAGLILARGGSTGIPLKNIAPLCQQPLLSWALNAMKNFKRPGFDSIWVSTDHQAIAGCAQKHAGVNVFARSAEFAKADTPSIKAVQEFLAQHPEVDVLGLVQCTSPFVQSQLLEQAYEKIMTDDYDSVFSVTRIKKLHWTEVEHNDQSTKPLNFDPSDRPRRQDWKGDLVENGMFYFARRHLLEKGLFQGGKCTYIEVPSKLSLEIDSRMDLAFAELLVSKACTMTE